MNKPTVLFVQRRPGKGGAQSALNRLLKHPRMRILNPVLVTSSEGWLTEQCRRSSVPFIIVPFPNSRSIGAFLWNNRTFAGNVARELKNKGDFNVQFVLGNDHLEGILAIALSKTLKTRRGIILRSSGMTQRDFFKYKCNAFDLIYAVGDELQSRAAKWLPQRNIQTFHDGLSEEDFFPPKPKAAAFPKKILVIGSELSAKGWPDLARAVDELEKEADFPALEFDLTGECTSTLSHDMQLEKKRRCAFHFIGKKEEFKELVRKYDLVLNPSQRESFGLAMMETWAAGVPMLSSCAGAAERVQKDPWLLFAPGDSGDMTEKLRHLWQQWNAVDFHVMTCQQNIRQNFMLDDPVEKLVGDLKFC